MSAESYRPARLANEDLDQIRQLEGQLGKVLVALSPSHEIASLSDQEVSRLREVEQQLGVVLVAYEGS